MAAEFKLAGVMGWPIAQSRSPILHNYWIEKYNLSGRYVPLAVRPERLADAIRGLPALGFRGCNLTMPHKQLAMTMVD
jgi:shikimate dehydrogenase